MRRITLPSGESIAVLGQGTWGWGEDPGRRGDEVAALHAGLELGMTLVDTAEMYGDGGAEQVVGQAIAEALRAGEVRREELFIVSKVYPHNASLEGTAAACARSLQRLGLDRIDLYLLHWRGSHPLADTVQAMIAHLKERLPRAFVIAGNVATPEAVIDLENWGADATKVGVGPGKVCITKLKTGFGTGGWQLSALKWCARVASKPIVADGGIRSHGDIAKSVRFGASMVMIGSLFAGHVESPGRTVEVDEFGSRADDLADLRLGAGGDDRTVGDGEGLGSGRRVGCADGRDVGVDAVVAEDDDTGGQRRSPPAGAWGRVCGLPRPEAPGGRATGAGSSRPPRVVTAPLTSIRSTAHTSRVLEVIQTSSASSRTDISSSSSTTSTPSTRSHSTVSSLVTPASGPLPRDGVRTTPPVTTKTLEPVPSHSRPAVLGMSASVAPSRFAAASATTLSA